MLDVFLFFAVDSGAVGPTAAGFAGLDISVSLSRLQATSFAVGADAADETL